MTDKLINSMNEDTTRVSAKYIRKLCKQYGIQITEQLRTKAIKAHYVRLISDAIIRELDMQSAKEEIQKFVNEVKSVCGRFYTYINLDSFARSCGIFYLNERVIIGKIRKSMTGVVYNYPGDSRNIERKAATVADAVDALIDRHTNSLRLSIA